MSNSYGYLKLMIQKANMISGIVGSIHVEIVVCNESIVQSSGNRPIRRLQIKRSTEDVAGPVPVWNDYMESLRRLVLDVDKENIPIGDNGYHLPQLLLAQLLEMADQNSEKANSSQSSYTQSAWSSLSVALSRMQECVFPRVLEEALLTQHFTSTVPLSPTPSVRSSGSTSSRVKRDPFAPTDKVSTGTTSICAPAVVEVYRVAATARSFLLSLLGGLPKHLSPTPSISLIEKQLSIFLAASKAPGSGASSGDSVVSGRSIAEHTSSDPMSWDTVLRFVVVVGVWFLQHSFIALTLLEEFDLSPKELHAIRAIWEKYDADLSGDIQGEDVAMLLQDMGEMYTPAEIAIIMSSIDTDNLHLAEFPEFIRWWCATDGVDN